MDISAQPYKIAIIGGIGSGKSVVSRLFVMMGIPVYNCDARAKSLMNTDKVLRQSLTSTIGGGVYGADGKLVRSYLASYMFGCKERVEKVNAIVHPFVRADFRTWAVEVGTPVVAVESAILYEAGMDADVDAVCLVQAPLELRLQRVVKRDGTDEASVLRRIFNQMSDDELLSRADHVVCNDDHTSLIAQVSQILRKIIT